jgi:hypothetical protein
MNENIFLTFEEKDNEEPNECNSSLMLEDLYSENLNKDYKNEDIYLEYCYYEMNYTIKQLIMIGEYYSLKNIKKANKFSIIYGILDFENKAENKELVYKRKLLWIYIDELKKDKFMKKYILF